MSIEALKSTNDIQIYEFFYLIFVDLNAICRFECL